MPMPKKFEDWTPPWGSDDEFDAAKAAKLVYDLKVDKETLQGKNSNLATKANDLQGKLDELASNDEPDEKPKDKKAEPKSKDEEKTKVSDSDLWALKLEVALDKGLSKVQAKRLVGSTLEELATDADELVASFGGAGAANEDDDKDEDETPVPSRQPRRLNNPGDPNPDEGKAISVEKAMELIPRSSVRI